MTGDAAASPPLFERAELERFLDRMTRAAGSNPEVLELEILPHSARLQFENPNRHGEVLEAAFEGGHFGAPRHAEIRGSGELSENLFALEDVALTRIPELTTSAAQRIDPENGRITRVLVRRHLPEDSQVRFRVYVESPRLSGSVDADAGGALLREPE